MSEFGFDRRASRDDGVRRSPKPRRKWAELADYISERTDDGAFLVDFAIDCVRGTVVTELDDHQKIFQPVDVRIRLDAAKWLTEMMVGKAPQSLEVSGLITHMEIPSAAIGALSDHDLLLIETTIARGLEAAAVAPPQLAAESASDDPPAGD